MTYVLYILMRNDLDSLNPGKACAQAAHAANDFQFVFDPVFDQKSRSVYEHYLTDSFNAWHSESKQNTFGTTIVLEGDFDQIDSAVHKYKNNMIYETDANWVADDTYPFFANIEIAMLLEKNNLAKIVSEKEPGQFLMTRSEKTCAWIFAEKDKYNIDLPLMK